MKNKLSLYFCPIIVNTYISLMSVYLYLDWLSLYVYLWNIQLIKSRCVCECKHSWLIRLGFFLGSKRTRDHYLWISFSCWIMWSSYWSTRCSCWLYSTNDSSGFSCTRWCRFVWKTSGCFTWFDRILFSQKLSIEILNIGRRVDVEQAIELIAKRFPSARYPQVAFKPINKKIVLRQRPPERVPIPQSVAQVYYHLNNEIFYAL